MGEWSIGVLTVQTEARKLPEKRSDAPGDHGTRNRMCTRHRSSHCLRIVTATDNSEVREPGRGTDDVIQITRRRRIRALQRQDSGPPRRWTVIAGLPDGASPTEGKL